MQAPRLAVTTVMLRPSATEIEVLLVRRPKTMRAFGDMWVFPGGQVDAADNSPAALALIPADAQQRCAMPFLSPDEDCPNPSVLPLFTAAIRELFEEAGVLIAHRPDGTGPDVAEIDALVQQRDAMLEQAGNFYAELAQRRLHLAIERLLPWSRWITPPGAARRFDTIFFVAVVDPAAQLLPHEGEIAGAGWLPLHATAASALRQERMLMAPTLLTLLQLSASLKARGSLEALFRGGSTGLLTPVRPKMLVRADQSWIVFPWDRSEGEHASHGWRHYSPEAAIPGRILSPI